MKRWPFGLMLLGVLSLALVACGGETSGEAPAEAAAPAEPLPVEGSDLLAGDGLEAQDEAARAETSAKKAKKKRKKGKKQRKLQAKSKKGKKQRRVAVVLGEPNEFDLVPAKPRVKAGMVTLKLKNTGSIEHELIVIRTDLDSGELPTDENGKAVEHGAVAPHHSGRGDGAEHAGAHVGTHVPAGEAGSVALKLEPGKYALVCNLPGHYASGMHSNFTVTS